MSHYFIFILGNVFCFGNMEIFCFDMLKKLVFQQKQEERLTSFFLISLEISLFVQLKFFD